MDVLFAPGNRGGERLRPVLAVHWIRDIGIREELENQLSGWGNSTHWNLVDVGEVVGDVVKLHGGNVIATIPRTEIAEVAVLFRNSGNIRRAQLTAQFAVPLLRPEKE